MTPFLLTGASGQLGSYLRRRLREEASPFVAWAGSRATEGCQSIDLSDSDAVRRAFRAADPAVVIHAAALARVADCHRDPSLAHRINATATETLAEECRRSGARLVYVSTDLVFAGDHPPYREDATPQPLSVYGKTKLMGELAAARCDNHLIARVSLLFGPALATTTTFFDDMVSALRERKPINLFHDEWRTPLDLSTAADALLALAQGEATGVVHVGGPERISRLEMGRRLATHLGVADDVIRAVGRDDVPGNEPRPCDLALDSARWRVLCPQVPWPAYEAALRSLLCG